MLCASNVVMHLQHSGNDKWIYALSSYANGQRTSSRFPSLPHKRYFIISLAFFVCCASWFLSLLQCRGIPPPCWSPTPAWTPCPCSGVLLMSVTDASQATPSSITQVRLGFLDPVEMTLFLHVACSSVCPLFHVVFSHEGVILLRFRLQDRKGIKNKSLT